MKDKMQTIIGIFTNREDANNAVAELERIGYSTHDISIAFPQKQESIGTKGGTASEKNITSPIVSGAVIGGLGGLLLGIASLSISGTNSLFANGGASNIFGLPTTSAIIIGGLVIGALLGGIIGAIFGPKPQVEEVPVDSQMKVGSTHQAYLLAVPATPGENANQARTIFEQYNADQVRSINEVRIM